MRRRTNEEGQFGGPSSRRTHFWSLLGHNIDGTAIGRGATVTVTALWVAHHIHGMVGNRWGTAGRGRHPSGIRALVAVWTGVGRHWCRQAERGEVVGSGCAYLAHHRVQWVVHGQSIRSQTPERPLIWLEQGSLGARVSVGHWSRALRVEVAVELWSNVGRSVHGHASGERRDNLATAASVWTVGSATGGTVIAVVPGLLVLLVWGSVRRCRLLAGHIRQRPDSWLVYHVCGVGRSTSRGSKVVLMLLLQGVVVVEEGVGRVAWIEHRRPKVVQGGRMEEWVGMSHRRSVEHFGGSGSTAWPRLWPFAVTSISASLCPIQHVQPVRGSVAIFAGASARVLRVWEGREEGKDLQINFGATFEFPALGLLAVSLVTWVHDPIGY